MTPSEISQRRKLGQLMLLRRKHLARFIFFASFAYHTFFKPIARSAWAHDRSPGSSWFQTHPQRSWFSEINFVRGYRLRPATFETLCAMLAPYATGQDTRYRLAIPLRIRVAMFLERCATGNTYYTIHKHYGFSENAVHGVVEQVAGALFENYFARWVHFPSNPSEFRRLAASFAKRRGFLNCIGDMDGMPASCTFEFHV